MHRRREKYNRDEEKKKWKSQREEKACAQSKGLKVRMGPVGNEGKGDNKVENTKKGNFYNELDKSLEKYQKIEKKIPKHRKYHKRKVDRKSKKNTKN